ETMSDLQARIITNLLDQVEALKLAAAPQPTHSGDTTADAVCASCATTAVVDSDVNAKTLATTPASVDSCFIMVYPCYGKIPIFIHG
ncbi:MAG: hypothetical protein VX866_11100, partial [Pseudomonadota bacterium]|nr:hypothetical protein [Pseudomonadota bacterium]